VLKNRKYNIRGIMKYVKRRKRREKKVMNILNNLSLEDLKSSIRVNSILESRSLYTED